jgi:hypothetical protein
MRMATQEYRIGMLLEHPGARGHDAVSRLGAALGDEDISDPDDAGAFEVTVSAASFDAALERVWNAVAAAGADDDIVFIEHPELPEHWQHRARARP